jgi:methylglyoxal synthase
LGSADKINSIIKFLSEGRKYIVIFFGDPYLAENIDSEVKVLTYSDSFASLASVVMKLAGRELSE